MPTRGNKDPNGRALRGRRAHTTFALLTDPARQIWNSFNNRANADGADAPEAAVNGCLYDRFKSLYNKTATKPSLVIVPARFKSGTLYSQIPSSNADFTVTRPLNTATRFDSSALIQTGITSGVPRLDYYTSGGVTGCPALLVEPSGTNTWLYSEPASATGYTAENVSFVTENLAGTVSAVLLLDSTVNRSLQQFIGNKQGQTWTMFFYVKVGAGVLPNQTGGTYRDFTLTIDNVDVNDAGFTYRHVGNGVYQVRHSRTFTTTFSNAVIRKYGSTNSNVPVVFSRIEFYSGDVPFGVSYIPTTTGSVTRNADVISVSGAVSGSIGQTEGTVYLEMQADAAGAGVNLFFIGDGLNADDFVSFGKNGANLRGVVRANNSSVFSQDFALTGGVIKAALAYKGGDTAFYANGSLVASGSTAYTFSSSLPSLGLGVSSFGFAAPTVISRYRAAALYTTRLTNDELQSLTQT